jgi:hyaluronoglucosaminidase
MSGSPFSVRALIEGFYGVFYTHPERLALLRFLGRHDYNLYIYAPKNDRQHRSRWREPYPSRIIDQFAEATRCAAEAGLDFCYALSPGIDISYSSSEDFAAITTKLTEFRRLGVRHFALLLDDIRRSFTDPHDAERYRSFAEAQADLCNRVYSWLRQTEPGYRLSMCPTDYHGLPPFTAALHELGALLDPDIDVFYTGREVCSPAIEAAEVAAFSRALGRRPVIWDNYPVNDLAMHGELHLGPIRGRAADLCGVTKGFAVNPMNQAEASKIALATFADYLAAPASYDPETSWRAALHEVAGAGYEQLRLVAENSLHSCLATPEAERLACLSDEAMAALEAGLADDPAVDALMAYLVALDEACYALRYRLENLELRCELLPWLEQLERWSWLGRWSVGALQSAQSSGSVEPSLLRRIDEYLGLVAAHPKRIAGTLLRPLALLALERCRQSEAA